MKFLIVDDHALIREAMRSVLRGLREDAVVLEAATGAQALASVDAERPDLVLLDIQLPDRNGFELLCAIQQRHPSAGIVMLSGTTDPDTVMRALSAGASGFIPKTESREVLIGALSLILAGGTYVPREALSAQRSSRPPDRLPETLGPPAVTPRSLGLTDRQLEVLALVMQGKSNKLICRTLDLAEPTVKNHVSAILKALGVASRTEAVIAVTALRWDLPRLP